MLSAPSDLTATEALRGWRPLIVLATKGRAAAAVRLFDELAKQTLPIHMVVAIGVTPDDTAGLGNHDLTRSGRALVRAAPVGSTVQRNAGLDALVQRGLLDHPRSFVVFFDDDFRPARDWLAQCANAFATMPDVAGLTGRTLADGAVNAAITEDEAQDYINGARAANEHWTNFPASADIDSLYGCNMAVRGDVAKVIRFDEALPLYAWQEDRDYTGQARTFGRMIAWPDCRGVHLGVKGGRTSGFRFGYSQIANPLHIARRGNIKWPRAIQMIAKALAANSYKSLVRVPFHDYFGRLRGNLTALYDLTRSRCAPGRILEFGNSP